MAWIKANIIPLVTGMALLFSNYTTVLLQTNALDYRLTTVEKKIDNSERAKELPELNSSRIQHLEKLSDDLAHAIIEFTKTVGDLKIAVAKIEVRVDK